MNYLPFQFKELLEQQIIRLQALGKTRQAALLKSKLRKYDKEILL